MRKFFTTFVLFCLPFAGFAAKHTVNVAGMAFSPQNLTINQNDTVVFEFTSGSHTVTSTTDAWDEIVASSPSTHELFLPFQIPGTYEYFCVPHQSMGMTGVITVEPMEEEITSLNIAREEHAITLYPNPSSSGIVSLSIPESIKATKIIVTNSKGKKVFKADVSDEKKQEYQIDISKEKSGIFYCTIYKEGHIVATRKFFLNKAE